MITFKIGDTVDSDSLDFINQILDQNNALQKSLISSLEIQAGKGFEVNDKTQPFMDEIDRLSLDNIMLKLALEKALEKI